MEAADGTGGDNEVAGLTRNELGIRAANTEQHVGGLRGRVFVIEVWRT